MTAPIQLTGNVQTLSTVGFDAIVQNSMASTAVKSPTVDAVNAALLALQAYVDQQIAIALSSGGGSTPNTAFAEDGSSILAEDGQSILTE